MRLLYAGPLRITGHRGRKWVGILYTAEDVVVPMFVIDVYWWTIVFTLTSKITRDRMDRGETPDGKSTLRARREKMGARDPSTKPATVEPEDD